MQRASLKKREEAEKSDMLKIRLVCYTNFITHWGDPKKKPPTIDQYWPLEDQIKKIEVQAGVIENFMKVSQEYYKKKNG